METFNLGDPENPASKQNDENIDPIFVIRNFCNEDSNDHVENGVYVIQPETDNQNDAVTTVDVNNEIFVVNVASSDISDVDVADDPVKEISSHRTRRKRKISNVMEKNSVSSCLSHDDGASKQKIPRIDSDVSKTKKKTLHKDMRSACLSVLLKQTPHSYRESAFTVFEKLLKLTENSPVKKNLSGLIDLRLNAENQPSINLNPIVVLDRTVCNLFEGLTKNVSVVEKRRNDRIEQSSVEGSIVSSHGECEYGRI